MGIADDITKLRDAGKSDEQILEGLKSFGGTQKYADDITKLQEAKRSPKDIVDGIGSYDSKYGAEGSRGTLAKITDPFKYGASKAAEGYQSTLHETGNDGVISDATGSVSKMLAPEQGTYTPAHVTLNPKTWGDIPKALAESAPGMAPDLAAGAAGAALGGAVGGPFAPITAPIGGVLGATGSYLARNYGNDARTAATVRGGGDNSELTAGDKARALLMGTVGGITSRLSLGALGSPVKAEAGSMARQLLPQVGKGALIDAGTNVAQEGAHQAIIDQKLEPSALGGALVTGAATGVGMRGASALKDVNAASKFKDVDAKNSNPVANDLLGVDSPHKAGSGEDSFFRVKKVGDDYAIEANNALSSQPMRERLKALAENDPLDPTAKTVDRVKQDIAEGRRPAQADLDLINNRVGDVETGGPSVTDLFKRQDTLNQLKSKGNWDTGAETFTGGLSSTPFVQKFLNPTGKIGAITDAGALAYALSGHTLPGLSVMHALADPVSAAAIPVAQIGTFGALHGIDRITGSRNPLELFTNRFSGEPSAPGGGTPGTPTAPGGPQTGAEIAAAVTKARADAALEKFQQNHERTDATKINRAVDKQKATEQSAASSLDRQRSAAFVKEQVGLESAKASLEKQRQAALQSASAALEKQRSAALAKEAATEFNGPKEDATLRIRVAKYAQEQQAKRDKAASKEDAKLAKEAAAGERTRTKGAKQEQPAPQPPGTTKIVHRDGVRNQVDGEVRNQHSSVENGVATRADARREIMSGLLEEPLSAAGKQYVKSHMDKMLTQSFRANKPHLAKGLMEDHLAKLNHHDAQLVRNHLNNATDPVTGHTYYSTWE